MNATITVRRMLMDEACLRLRALLGAADSNDAALNDVRAYLPTPDEARALADAADRQAEQIRAAIDFADTPAATIVGRLAASLVSHANHVRFNADDLDRAIVASNRAQFVVSA